MQTSILFAAFVWLQYEDTRTTNIGMDMGAIELNPAVSWLMENLGKWWVAIKIPAIAGCLYAAIHQAWLLLLIADAVYIYVVAKNHKAIDKLSR